LRPSTRAYVDERPPIALETLDATADECSTQAQLSNCAKCKRIETFSTDKAVTVTFEDRDYDTYKCRTKSPIKTQTWIPGGLAPDSLVARDNLSVIKSNVNAVLMFGQARIDNLCREATGGDLPYIFNRPKIVSGLAPTSFESHIEKWKTNGPMFRELVAGLDFRLSICPHSVVHFFGYSDRVRGPELPTEPHDYNKALSLERADEVRGEIDDLLQHKRSKALCLVDSHGEDTMVDGGKPKKLPSRRVDVVLSDGSC